MSAAQLPLVPSPPTPEPESDVDFWTMQGQAITGIPDWPGTSLLHLADWHTYDRAPFAPFGVPVFTRRVEAS